MPGDLRDGAFCERLVEDAVRALGGLDILVNDAGRPQQAASLSDITTEAFDATTKTDIDAMFWLTKAALKHFQPGSFIIQTTSQQAYDPSENLTDDAITKAAGMSFARSMAEQLGRPGQPAELPSIYVRLADNGASFSTGQVYGAAGGSGQP